MGLRGLEPPRVAPTDPKSVASANFATGPFHLKYRIEAKKRAELPTGGIVLYRTDGNLIDLSETRNLGLRLAGD